MIYIQIALFALLLISVVHTVGKWRTKYLMERADRNLREQGVHPAGATVCHGMTFKNGERGVNSEHQESLAWYCRIFRSPFYTNM